MKIIITGAKHSLGKNISEYLSDYKLMCLDGPENCGGIYINNYETIKKETNGIINDYHWSEVTHQNLSKFFIEIITNELKIEKKLI